MTLKKGARGGNMVSPALNYVGLCMSGAATSSCRLSVKP